MLKKLETAVAALFLIGVVLYYSAHWIVPVMREASDTAYHYLPVHYYGHTQNDDYFYYSRIREAIDGLPFAGDHATVEHKFAVTPHATYSLSFFVGSIGGWFTKKTEHAYYFNYIFFPAVIFLSLFLLGRFLGVYFPFILVIISKIVLDFEEVSRTPNILITSVFLNLLAIVLFQKFELKKTARTWDAALVGLIGLSPLTSIPNFFLSYGLFVAFVFFYSGQGINFKGYARILVASLVLSLPGIFIIVYAMLGNNSEYFQFGIPPLSRYKGFHYGAFIESVAHLRQWYLLPLLMFSYRNKRFYMTVLFAFTALYFFLLGLEGTFSASYIFYRGGEVLFTFCVFAGLVQIVRTAIGNRQLALGWLGQPMFVLQLPVLKVPKAWTTSRKKSAVLIVGSFLVLLAPFKTMRQSIERKFVEARQSVEYYNLKELKELSHWAIANVKRGSSVVALDFDLITSIGIYTPLDTYIGFAHHSPMKNQERWQRLFETIQYYGQGREFLRAQLQGMEGHYFLDGRAAEQSNLNLMQLVMFYGLYCDHRMPKDKVDEILNQFDAAEKSKMSFQANYLIVTEISSKFIKLGSKADHVVHSSAPLFENKKYKVFRL